MKSKIICLDFDGVIHSYKSGWKGAKKIPDEPIYNAINWIEKFIMCHCTPPESICSMAPEGKFRLYIYSSRSKYFGGRKAMKKWLIKHGLDKRFLEVIKFPSKKPPAFLTIDDRVIPFCGTFPSFEEIINFEPWNKGEEGGENARN